MTPVVILPPEEVQQTEENAVDGNLVDTSDTNSIMTDLVDLNHRNGSISPDVLAERYDVVITIIWYFFHILIKLKLTCTL